MSPTGVPSPLSLRSRCARAEHRSRPRRASTGRHRVFARAIVSPGPRGVSPAVGLACGVQRITLLWGLPVHVKTRATGARGELIITARSGEANDRRGERDGSITLTMITIHAA